MPDSIREKFVDAAMRPISDLDVPAVLRSSIERHSCNLLELTTGLLHAGLDEAHVRCVVNDACTSYRDELIAAILALRVHHEA